MANAKGGAFNGSSNKANRRSDSVRQDLPREWNDAGSVLGADYLDFVSPATAKRESQSGLCLVVDGVAGQMDQLHAIGNGQVPAVVRIAWHALAGLPTTGNEASMSVQRLETCKPNDKADVRQSRHVRPLVGNLNGGER